MEDRKASFKDVEFEIENIQMECGNRLVTHEYPQQDTPYIENLGNKAKKITVQAWVIADDAYDRRNALLKAVEEKEPGTLVIPSIGEIEVYCEACSYSEDPMVRRKVAFTLSFVQTGVQKYPDGEIDTKGTVISSSDDLITKGQGIFAEAFSVEGFPSYVFDDAASALGEITSALTDGFSLVTSPLSDGVGFVTSQAEALAGLVDLITNPAALADGLVALFAEFGEFSLSDPFSTYTELASTGGVDAYQGGAYARTPTAARTAKNREALSDFTRLVAVGMAAKTLANDERVVSYDEAVSRRDSVVDEIDALSMGPVSNKSYVELRALRSAVITDTNTRAAAKPRVKSYAFGESLPPMVASYAIYGDATKEEEIIKRNRIATPMKSPLVIEALVK